MDEVRERWECSHAVVGALTLVVVIVVDEVGLEDRDEYFVAR